MKKNAGITQRKAERQQEKNERAEMRRSREKERLDKERNMTVEEQLDAAKELINKARSIQVSVTNPHTEDLGKIGREAYLRLQSAYKTAQADGTLKQHSPRLHEYSDFVLTEIFHLPEETA